jgi:hypothetical protein
MVALISALGRLRQENYEFGSSLDHRQDSVSKSENAAARLVQ